SRRRHTRFSRDWSSDVCSSDLNFFHGTLVEKGKVSVAGINVACDDCRDFLLGSPVSVGLRPEEVRVRNVSPDDVNALHAEVDELEFMGAFCRAKLGIAGVKTPLFADFSANLMRDLAIERGQKIWVALPPEALRVFPNGEAHAQEVAA